MAANPPPPLWEFACRLYDRQGVKPALLWLQDRRQLDIPFYLFTLWADRSGRALAGEDFDGLLAASRAYAGHLIGPLRAGRRWLKGQDPGAESLYRLLLDTELMCEKSVLENLEGRFSAMAANAVVSGGNTRRYLRIAGIGGDVETDRHLAIVMAAARHLPGD